MSQIRTYAEKCLRDEAEALLNLIPLLTDDFDRAVEMIFHSKGRLIVTGVGKSGHIGAKIAATLASTGTFSSIRSTPSTATWACSRLKTLLW